MPVMRMTAGAALALLMMSAAASAQQTAPVELSNGTKVSQKVTLPKLTLSNAQREQVRKGVMNQNSDVEFSLKSARSAKDFMPAIGARLPKGVKALALPSAVLARVPQLRDYKYVTMKDRVLLVNPMTLKIVDVFSETQPVT